MVLLDIARGIVPGFRAVFAPASQSGLTYTGESFMGMFALVILVSIPPEVLLHHLFLQPAIAWTLDLAVVICVLLLFGIFGCMAQRPHVVGDDRVILRNGPFTSLDLARANILAVHEHPNAKKRALRRLYPDAVFLTIDAQSYAELEFAEPVIFKARKRQQLFVASDQPRDLCRRIRS